MDEVPTVAINHLSPAEISALKISLNRIQELSSWDQIVLKSELEILIEVDLGLVVFRRATLVIPHFRC